MFNNNNNKNKNQNLRILVTGATGFIGSRIVKDYYLMENIRLDA
jgi:FlaA1/EpsC-like NDP-sugar epimerase